MHHVPHRAERVVHAVPGFSPLLVGNVVVGEIELRLTHGLCRQAAVQILHNVKLTREKNLRRHPFLSHLNRIPQVGKILRHNPRKAALRVKAAVNLFAETALFGVVLVHDNALRRNRREGHAQRFKRVALKGLAACARRHKRRHRHTVLAVVPVSVLGEHRALVLHERVIEKRVNRRRLFNRLNLLLHIIRDGCHIFFPPFFHEKNAPRFAKRLWGG